MAEALKTPDIEIESHAASGPHKIILSARCMQAVQDALAGSSLIKNPYVHSGLLENTAKYALAEYVLEAGANCTNKPAKWDGMPWLPGRIEISDRAGEKPVIKVDNVRSR